MVFAVIFLITNGEDTTPKTINNQHSIHISPRKGQPLHLDGHLFWNHPQEATWVFVSGNHPGAISEISLTAASQEIDLPTFNASLRWPFFGGSTAADLGQWVGNRKGKLSTKFFS